MENETPPTPDARHAAELLELGDAFFELDRDWRIVQVNRRQEELSRKPRTETVGRTFAQVWPELGTADSRYWREYQRCMTERVPVQFEEYYAPLRLWTGVTAYPISTGGIAVFFRDITLTKKAEHEQARLASIVESTDDAIVSKDLDGVIVTWNAGAERIFGYAADEVVGRGIDLLLPPDRSGEEDRILAELRAGRRIDHFETTRVRKDGTIVDVAVSVSPIHDRSGRLVGASKIARDITERKRTERSLRAERDLSAAVLDTLATLVVVLDPDGRVVRFNRACERATGYAEREVLGQSVFGLLVPEPDVAGAAATFRRLRMGDFPNAHRNRWRTRDGAERLVDWSNTVIADEHGAVAFIIATGVDITEREQRLEALRESEERFRSLFDSAAVGIGRVALDGRFLQVNESYARLVGYAPEELVAMDFQRITHPDDLARDVRQLGELVAGRIPSYRMDKRYLRRDGSTIWVSLSVGLARDGDGRPAYCSVVVEDISARKRAEDALRDSEAKFRDANEKLRDADRRKDEFLGMLSHELRNPLAPIRNSLYLLDHAEPTGQQARRAKDVVNRQIAHLTRLVDDLLDVTRIARAKVELRRAPVDLARLVRRTAEDYRALLHDRDVELVVAVSGAPLVVDGDETRLAQVVGNLLSNSAKFTPPGGRVTLATEARGERAVVHLRDTGVGVAPDLLPTIFDPFIQAKQTLARSEGGLGLGLALVKGLTELHGGRVSASSGGPGAGTEFTVELPLARATVSARPQEAAPRAHPTYRVLVVDDNVDAAETLAELVRLFGHEVEVAHDGPSAVASVEARRPDVVLCDLGLPGMDGYAVARALRARLDRNVRLVAVSGYAQPDDVKRSVEAGFDAHVAKPPDPARIERLLA